MPWLVGWLVGWLVAAGKFRGYMISSTNGTLAGPARSLISKLQHQPLPPHTTHSTSTSTNMAPPTFPAQSRAATATIPALLSALQDTLQTDTLTTLSDLDLLQRVNTHATTQYKAMADAAQGGLGGDLVYLQQKCTSSNSFFFFSGGEGFCLLWVAGGGGEGGEGANVQFGVAEGPPRAQKMEISQGIQPRLTALRTRCTSWRGSSRSWRSGPVSWVSGAPHSPSFREWLG